MNKSKCNDRENNNHFGEFGWYDGYNGSIGNCRVSLKTRSSSCEDADFCCEECQKRIGNKGTNIISETINNMHRGEIKRQQEEKEDNEISAAKRKKEKEEAQKIKEEVNGENKDTISSKNKFEQKKKEEI